MNEKITTEEGLAELPGGSVVVDKFDDVVQLRGGLWCGYETAPMTHHRLAKYAPITVLRRGGPR